MQKLVQDRMQKWSTGKRDDERCSETRKSGKCNTPLLVVLFYKEQMRKPFRVASVSDKDQIVTLQGSRDALAMLDVILLEFVRQSPVYGVNADWRAPVEETFEAPAPALPLRDNLNQFRHLLEL